MQLFRVCITFMQVVMARLKTVKESKAAVEQLRCTQVQLKFVESRSHNYMLPLFGQGWWLMAKYFACRFCRV